jgi:hypothetical protein
MYCFEILDVNFEASGSGSRREKMTTKIKKWKKFLF